MINMASEDSIISSLKKIVGDSYTKIDEETKKNYGQDLTQQFFPNPLAVVFPQNQNHVIEIVKLANEMKIALVPSGGRTGYSGAAVAKNRELVVSFDKMNRILDFNLQDKTVRCEPGVITKNLQNFAVEHGLYYPVDFSSSGSSQMGGNIATNAGGIKVIRYGLTRDRVVGLSVVTGNADVLVLNNGLIKNSSGYDLRHLFIGSEGTLGFITEAILKLTVISNEAKVILFSLSEKKYFLDILDKLNSKIKINAFEFFSQIAIAHVIDSVKLKFPFENQTPFYILLEYESDETSDEFVLKMSEELLSKKMINGAIISSSHQQFKNLWRFREEISMSLRSKIPYKYDISVLPSKIPDFMNEIDSLFKRAYPNFEIVWFGHVGDGNLHLNILKPDNISKDDFFSKCDAISNDVYSLINQYKGSISAEHGVGLLRKKFLIYSKSEVEIDYMRGIKKLFDRNNIMNPGKIFDAK